MKRMIDSNKFKEVNDEIIINQGLSVSIDGDVIVGKDLEADGSVIANTSLKIGDTELTEEQLIALKELLG